MRELQVHLTAERARNEQLAMQVLAARRELDRQSHAPRHVPAAAGLRVCDAGRELQRALSHPSRRAPPIHDTLRLFGRPPK